MCIHWQNMNYLLKNNNHMKKTALFTILTLLSWAYTQAQSCDPEFLSRDGLQHFTKSQVYIENLEQGTHEKVVEELELLVKTDSLWCYEVYLQLGRVCEEIYAKKKTTNKIDYLKKAILYYKKYSILKPNNTIVVGKIAELQALLELAKSTVNNDDNIEMVYVEGMLNSDTTDCIHSFYIGKYEVTQAQWEAVMGSNPSHFKGPNLPVENVSYYDVQLFINELNRLTGNNYRLPTEKEWEYAMHGGKNQEPYTYSGSYSATKVGWVKENSNGRTHPVGEKDPNSIGIYDMTGNVAEFLMKKHHARGYKRGDYDYYIATGYSWRSFESFESNSWMGIKKNAEIGFRMVISATNYSSEEQNWDTMISEKEQRRVLQYEQYNKQREQEERAKINNAFRFLPTIGFDFKNLELKTVLLGASGSIGPVYVMALYQQKNNFHFALGGKLALYNREWRSSLGICGGIAYSTTENVGLNVGLTFSRNKNYDSVFGNLMLGTLIYKNRIIPLLGIGIAIP